MKLGMTKIQVESSQQMYTKSLAETHQSPLSDNRCSNCDKKTRKINMYTCCLEVNCNNCYNNLHQIECINKNKSSQLIPNYIQNYQCQRCQDIINYNYYSCQNCKILVLCQSCFNLTHRNNHKFQIHIYQQNYLYHLEHLSNIITCQQHKKIKNVITQTAQLACIDCINTYKLKKFKYIDYCQSSKQSQKQIQNLSKTIKLQQYHHQNKWKQLKNQLQVQYQKLSHLLKQRYQQNILTLNQMQDNQIKIINKALKQSQKYIKQSMLDFNQLGISNSLVMARMGILCCKLYQAKQNILATQQYTYKMTKLQSDKLQNLIKNWSIYKIKARECQDKQNYSVKKPGSSCIKPNQSNLSISRRSVQKSLIKNQIPRQSELKNPMISIIPLITKSQNQSNQQLNTQIRNSTPPHTYKNPINSSDKKSIIIKQTSIMNSKLEDITPVILNFDFKDNNINRVNFISNKTQQDNNKDSNSNIPGSQNLSQPRTSKKKSDFFDLRDRMRKPNIVSVINNRFTKR